MNIVSNTANSEYYCSINNYIHIWINDIHIFSFVIFGSTVCIRGNYQHGVCVRTCVHVWRCPPTEASLDYPDHEKDQMFALDTLAAYFVQLARSEKEKTRRREFFTKVWGRGWCGAWLAWGVAGVGAWLVWGVAGVGRGGRGVWLAWGLPTACYSV